MTQPFLKRLKTYYAKAGQVLRAEAGAASIFPNTTDIGISRERVYAELLRLHAPKNCTVNFGGFVFGLDGAESGQIDVIVSSDSALQYNLHNREGGGKTFACVDGAIAVASLKSTLDSTQLRDALDNLASLPDKSPIEGRIMPALNVPQVEYNDWPFKIVYAPEGIGCETLTNTLLDYYKSHPDVPTWRRPNLIHVAGKYSLQRPLTDVPKRGGGTWPAQRFHPYKDETDVFGLIYALTRIQEIASAQRFILHSYAQLADRMHFEGGDQKVWTRIE